MTDQILFTAVNRTGGGETIPLEFSHATTVKAEYRGYFQDGLGDQWVFVRRPDGKLTLRSGQHGWNRDLYLRYSDLESLRELAKVANVEIDLSCYPVVATRSNITFGLFIFDDDKRNVTSLPDTNQWIHSCIIASKHWPDILTSSSDENYAWIADLSRASDAMVKPESEGFKE